MLLDHIKFVSVIELYSVMYYNRYYKGGGGMWTSSFRYDKEARDELNFIVSKLGVNKSEAITEAIHTFYKILKESNSKEKSSAEIFLESGFVAGHEDEELLSTNYKEKLSKQLKDKYDFKTETNTR